MSDWSRKHFCDVVSVCDTLMATMPFPREEMEALLDIRESVKALARNPRHASPTLRSSDSMLGELCAFCIRSVGLGCSGRSTWREPCALLDMAKPAPPAGDSPAP